MQSSNQEGQGRRVLTLGYTGLKMEKIVATVEKYEAVLADVRFMPFSRFAGWRKSAFMEALNQPHDRSVPSTGEINEGPRYIHIPELGNKNYKGGPILINDLENGIKVIGELFRYETDTVILMCACADPDHCHRTTVAHHIYDRLGVDFSHLTFEQIMGFPQQKAMSPARAKREQKARDREAQTSLLPELGFDPFAPKDNHADPNQPKHSTKITD